MLAIVLATAVLAGGDWPGIGAVVPLDPGTGPGSDLGAVALVDGVAYVAYCRALAAADPEGLAEIVNERRGIFQRPGTRARVLEYHTGFKPIGAEVRILDGAQKGRRMWVPAYYLLAGD